MKRKMIIGIISIGLLFAAFFGYKAYNSSSKPAKPNDDRCDNWKWNEEEGVWVCDSTSSSYYRHFFYGGSYFSNRSALSSDPSYSSYKSSSTFKGGFSKGTSGGFGG